MFTEDPEFIRDLEKRPRKNPLGENVYIVDGKIVRQEDAILVAQRIWRERAYAPGGKMYLKTFEHFTDLTKYS